jgi:nicotinamide mononucleotide adenylyltransferase
MFEMASDFAKFNTDFEVLGGFLSPVSDAYKKGGLTSARHRYVSHSHPTNRSG